MNEEQARQWMNGLADSLQHPLPAAERIWMLAQLEADSANRREADRWVGWVDTAVRCAAGLAFAALSLSLVWLV